ncbi:MAG TPA: autotransporter domain-containing protein [Rudaea sp.]|nr:autotransporter domain-containing protein [Rudaea sp.]
MTHVAGVPRRGVASRFHLLVIAAALLAPLAAYAQSLTIVSGNNQSLVPNQASQVLTVQARDAQGAPLSGAAIGWSSPNATASFATSSKTDGSGQSTNRLTAILPGNYTLTAQIIESSSSASVTFSFNVGVANLNALTPGQNAVAHAIDVACPTLATSQTPISDPQKDFLNRCSEIVVGAGRSEIPTALEAMLNNKTQPQSQMSNNVQSSQSANLTARMGALRAGVQGVSLGGVGIVNDGKALSLATLGDAFRKDPGQDAEAGASFSRWGFFANGMITRGTFAANQSRPGFDFDGASLTAGVDYRFNDNFVAGVALGYNNDSSDLDLDAGKLDVDGYSVNGYFVWYHGNDFYVQGSLEFNQLNFDLRRNIIYQIAAIDGSGGTTSINQVARASPGGDQQSFNLTLGRDFNSGALQFSPYLRGTWSHLSLDGFTESIASSAPGFGLATEVDSRSRTNEIGVIGALFSYTASQNWGVLVPNARLEFNHDFKTDPQVVVSRFVSDPTQTEIVVSDPRLDHNFYNVGLGLNALWPQGRSGYLAYEYVGGLTGGHLNRFEAGFRIEF